MTRRRDQDWCIVRTSPGRTLALARSLSKAGFDAWTPARMLRRRRPRSQKTIDIDVPIMPSFVFVRARHLQDLAVVTTLPVSPHPPFSIFRHSGRIPLIADAEIAGARAEEARAQELAAREAVRSHRRIFTIGQKVSVPEGAFVGLEGVVQGGDGRFALVTFGGAITLKVATFLLTSDELQTPPTRAGVNPHTLAA